MTFGVHCSRHRLVGIWQSIEREHPRHGVVVEAMEEGLDSRGKRGVYAFRKPLVMTRDILYLVRE